MNFCVILTAKIGEYLCDDAISDAIRRCPPPTARKEPPPGTKDPSPSTADPSSRPSLAKEETGRSERSLPCVLGYCVVLLNPRIDGEFRMVLVLTPSEFVLRKGSR